MSIRGAYKCQSVCPSASRRLAVRRQLEFGTKRQIVDIPTLFSTKEMDEVLLLSAICNDDLNNLASISGLVSLHVAAGKTCGGVLALGT